KTSIFSHPVYLFLRKFSLQDSRGGSVPHIGSATHETRYGMAACAVDNLIDALQGKVEKNCVNPHVAD
ncbi:hypothetical protein QU914_23840, partial [Escherichia coli]|nr:hypothetical protein [Escherichia coli]